MIKHIKLIKHTGIMSSLGSELEVVGCESITGKYYVYLFWFYSFFMYLLWFIRQNTRPAALLVRCSTPALFFHIVERCGSLLHVSHDSGLALVPGCSLSLSISHFKVRYHIILIIIKIASDFIHLGQLVSPTVALTINTLEYLEYI